MTADPFSMVFNTAWDIVSASVPLSGLVRPGNRIKYNVDDNRSPIKTQVAEADLPELILVSGGTTDINSHSSSCGSSIVRQYQWLVSTGDFRIHHRLYPVQFALFAALIDSENLFNALTWKSKKFVKEVRWQSLTEGLSNSELNRGIRGWSSLWAFTVFFDFATADLKTFSNTGT